MRKLITVLVAATALTALPGPVSAHEPDDSDCSDETHAVLGDRADWAAVELVAWVLKTDCLLDSGNRKLNSLPSTTTALYNDQQVIVVGGPAAVPETKLSGLDVEQRLWGADRLETMRAVVEWADEQAAEPASSQQDDDERVQTGSCTHAHAGAPTHTHVRYSDGTVSGHSHEATTSTKCGYLWIE